LLAFHRVLFGGGRKKNGETPMRLSARGEKETLRLFPGGAGRLEYDGGENRSSKTELDLRGGTKQVTDGRH